MFKCQNAKCNYRGQQYESPIRVVTETRPKVYENTLKRGKKAVTIRSEGTEIVKEISICASCAEKILGV